MAFIQAQGGSASTHDREPENAGLESMGRIVQASFVTQKQKSHIASLLEARADSEEDAEMGSGVMNVDAIMETLGEMESGMVFLDPTGMPMKYDQPRV